MRRFSSEGSLLDLDFLPWKKVALKNQKKNLGSGTYTPHMEEVELQMSAGLTPTIQEPRPRAGEGGNEELTKEHSLSAENMSELGKLDNSHLRVCVISEGCRAYSDGQLASAAQGSSDTVEREDLPPPSPPFSSNPFSFSSQSRQNHKPKRTAAKLHLKTLFGQSPHSSNSNLSNTEQIDSATERRSRLLFMRQWSQMAHSKKRRISQKELEKWAESLNTLLASQTGVSVFGAFLRSEFSEENLQFFLACEQYRHSSNNFSLQRRAKDICATYIQPGAPREVHTCFYDR
ncbi:putative regulator of G-protein signaling 8-like isoform 2 [Scophthalmus maximus]|uniref:Putative regulator of G-protein signaling 8-like isoform 2 n=1 Tax=Scophthalmus maximus TaxID=52904 RepID=A0A2U9BLP8_SCOMX|nr:putative regulator of G-protein signaling 8-like isoform 2 [Scophthalmus maximus]